RLRIFELRSALPEREELDGLLHRSIQFYNPAKERCTLRLDPLEPEPLGADEIGVLVVERSGERRPAAERWWRHETGAAAGVGEGGGGRARAATAEPGPESEGKEDHVMNGWCADKTWREECGIFGAFGVPRAAEIVGLGLHALQHRGQESTGIVSCDPLGEFH